MRIAHCFLIYKGTSTTTLMRKFTLSPDDPRINLEDIGYDGTWDEFCNMKAIEGDFAFYPHHELRTLRLSICERRKQNEINCTRSSLMLFAVYKYCATVSVEWKRSYLYLCSILHHTDLKNISKWKIHAEIRRERIWDFSNVWWSTIEETSHMLVDHLCAPPTCLIIPFYRKFRVY